MPATVDHQQRRKKIAEIAADFIVRDGLEAVTIRNVAAAAGFSTTIVTHYFSDKYSLLRHTYALAADHAKIRIDAALGKDPADLRSCMEALLPLDEGRLRDWKIYFTFWQVALRDDGFASEQRRWTQTAHDILRRTIEARRKASLIAFTGTANELATRLLTMIHGIAIQVLVDRPDWSPQQQRAFLRKELRQLAIE